jgi:hypothetical protein
MNGAVLAGGVAKARNQPTTREGERTERFVQRAGKRSFLVPLAAALVLGMTGLAAMLLREKGGKGDNGPAPPQGKQQAAVPSGQINNVLDHHSAKDIPPALLALAACDDGLPPPELVAVLTVYLLKLAGQGEVFRSGLRNEHGPCARPVTPCAAQLQGMSLKRRVGRGLRAR